jgi:hypothetical protein
MQRLVIAAFAAATSFVGITSARAQAEHYDPIRVDSGLTGTYVPSYGRGGFGAMVEPKFMVHDHIAVGLRIEAAVMFGGSFNDTGDTKIDVGAVGALMAKGEYLFGNGGVRPFVALGLGVFDIASQSVSAGSSTASIDQKAGEYFGIAPQAGIDLGRVRFAVTYDAILGANVEVHQTVGGAMQSSSYSQSYLGFEMSFRFGGGRRHPPRLAPPPAVARQ